jgi:hypothetical protein
LEDAAEQRQLNHEFNNNILVVAMAFPLFLKPRPMPRSFSETVVDVKNGEAKFLSIMLVR